jgi:hypothetical protein
MVYALALKLYLFHIYQYSVQRHNKAPAAFLRKYGKRYRVKSPRSGSRRFKSVFPVIVPRAYGSYGL